MPITDKREPGVYVSIEDRSYSEPAIETGRTVYGVILTDRGPHDRVVGITSKSQFHKLFGRPNFRRCSQTVYQIDKALDYTSSIIVTRVVPADSYWANTYIRENTAGTAGTETYNFTSGSNEVTCTDQAAYNAFSVGQWIYQSADTAVVAAQVISKSNVASSFKLILDRKYAGTSGTGVTAVKFLPYEFQTLPSVTSENLFNDPTHNTVYYFYANGAGSYYNKLIVRGTRNTDLEKYYIDEITGDPLYPYMFMDVAVYEVQDNGTQKLVEGPWTVSLTPRYPGNNPDPVKDLTSGRYLFIEDVINTESDLIRCVASTRDAVTGEPKGEFPAITKMMDSSDAELRRLQVMLMLTNSALVGTVNVTNSTGAIFESGTDGTGLFDTGGNYNPNEALLGRVAQAYNGSLESVDKSVEQLPEFLYAWYSPDYIICGGFPATVQHAAFELSSRREDCLTLADTGGYKTSYEDDIESRLNDVPWNHWSAALYVQWRKIADQYTGQKIWASPVYHAIERHLYCDGAYWISEPVAGIEKGAINESIDLAYKANHTERGNLLEKELNCVIVEPQGKYILTQYTTYKRLSVLKRLHVAKFIMYLKKTIPSILKDLLQRKATPFWIGQAQLRVNSLLNKFVEGPTERYSILKSFTVHIEFDDTTSSMNVSIDIVPIRAIERINVVIGVQ